MVPRERRLNEKLKEIQHKLETIHDQINFIPCLIIDGLEAIPIDPDNHWKSHVLTILNVNHIYKSWVLNILNEHEHIRPSTVIIQFVNNIVRNQAYRILCQYVIDNEFDALITKDDTKPL
jgi:hypothetical protein